KTFITCNAFHDGRGPCRSRGGSLQDQASSEAYGGPQLEGAAGRDLHFRIVGIGHRRRDGVGERAGYHIGEIAAAEDVPDVEIEIDVLHGYRRAEVATG